MIVKSLAKMTQNIVERSIEQAYMKGIEDAQNDECKEIEFLKQWKADVIDSLSKYDCDSVEEVFESGRKDAFQEIACSDNVIKEPFEILAYNKGRAEALKPIQKLLDDWFCDRVEDANWVLSQISIAIYEMTKG